MPIIEVWGLGDIILRRDVPLAEAELHGRICMAVLGIPELGLKDWSQVAVFFPQGSSTGATSREVIVWVRGLFEKPERTDEVRNRLAEAVGRVIRESVSEADRVECFIESFNPQRGFWSSAS